MPLGGVDLLERGVDPHLLEVAHHEAGEIEIDRDRTGDDLDLERVGRAEAGLGQELPGLAAPRFHSAIAGQAVQVLLEQAPRSPRAG